MSQLASQLSSQLASKLASQLVSKKTSHITPRIASKTSRITYHHILIQGQRQELCHEFQQEKHPTQCQVQSQEMHLENIQHISKYRSRYNVWNNAINLERNHMRNWTRFRARNYVRKTFDTMSDISMIMIHVIVLLDLSLSQWHLNGRNRGTFGS